MTAANSLATEMSSSLEDYLETIYLLVQERGFARVKDIALARHVKAPTVSVALRKLDEEQLVRYERREFIALTTKGEEAARRILARHRLLSRFFEGVLRMSPEAAGEQACAIEHGLTYEAMDRMVRLFEFLGNCPSMRERFEKCPMGIPGDRPHGRAPCSSCEVCAISAPSDSVSVADLGPGGRAIVRQIAAKGALRQRILDMGILPDTVIDVESVGPNSRSLSVRCQGTRLTLRNTEARAIRVKQEEP